MKQSTPHGNVNVRARALVARGKGLSQEAPLDGSIVGGHDVSWGSASGILRLSCQCRVAARARRLARSQTGLRPIREDAGA